MSFHKLSDNKLLVNLSDIFYKFVRFNQTYQLSTIFIKQALGVNMLEYNYFQQRNRRSFKKKQRNIWKIQKQN